jgi:F0F1-type ATP synthase delta subunit
VAGRIGEHLGELYAAGQKGKNFDKIVKDLEAVAAAVKGGGLVVERFFSTANYSPVECKKVVELLLTSKESLASFKDIKDEDVREILVDNEGNLGAWLGVRKAIGAIGLSDAVKTLLEKLAAEGRLERVRKLAAYAQELKNVTLKTTDAIVTSAVPLSKAQQEAIAKTLPNYVPSGTSVNPVFAVDPAIVGGLTVTLKNQSIDLSANSRLVEVVSA